MVKRTFFLCAKADFVGRQLAQATFADDVAEVRRVSNCIDAGNQLWVSWCNNRGGSVLGINGDEIRMEMPFTALDEVEIKQKEFKTAANTGCCIGVGNSLSEAQKALIAATLIASETLKCYTSLVEDIIEQAKEDENQASWVDEMFSKSETTTPMSDLRIEFRELLDELNTVDAVQQEAEVGELERGQDLDDLKTRVKSVVKEIGKKLPQLEQLQQSNPEVYHSITGLLRSVEEMASRLFTPEELSDSDLLHGGKADGTLDEEFPPEQLAEGIKHESEHTQNASAAKEIAKDHLSENPQYYTDLQQIEKASLEAGTTGRHNVILPVGSTNNGKIKVKLPTGKAGWRSVRSGLAMDAEGNPISVRRA